jgi:hypothetical protein
VGLRAETWVLNEAVADECNGNGCAPEDDGPETGAAGFRGLKSYATGGTSAAEREPPAFLASLNVLELREHRLRPLRALRRQPAQYAGEEPSRAIVLGAAAEPTHNHRNSQCRENGERQHE